MSRDALVVGINHYQHLKSLRAPAEDAEAISQRLSQDGDFSVIRRLPETIAGKDVQIPVVSKTQPVSREQLKLALKQLFLPGSTQAPETALFYFSGHGIQGEDSYDKGYLATSDFKPNNPSSGLSLGWLQWLLSESEIKQQIIWLDCCHSGSLLVKVGAANPGNSESRDRCFIASSRDFEASWEDINSKYSVFTKVLLEGLDPQRLPGRRIDTFSLADYMNQVLEGDLQRPICTLFGAPIWLTRRRSVPLAPSPPPKDTCPYKGLEFFDCNDEDPKYFFGRERLVSKLLDQVRTSNFMALVGASGSGKSSVLRAGLLHQLKLGQRITGSEEWQIRITRPEKTPIWNLAEAFVSEKISDIDRAIECRKAINLLNEGGAGLQRLVTVSTAPRTILVVDQFEEVFTRCRDAAEREQYFACLMQALANTEWKLCLIIAMRSDFIVKCHEQQYSGLAKQIDQQMTTVLPMNMEELKAAIYKPAEQVGLWVDSTLVKVILKDIRGAPGSLPLMQYALKALWLDRHNDRLELATYQALGGIEGTLDRRATAIYNRLSYAEQQTVQHIFQQLTVLGEGADDTRRRVFLRDLVSEPKHPKERVEQVISQLSSSENRLLVASEGSSQTKASERMIIIDVAHEALIQNWRLLRQWIAQNHDLLRQQRKIEASASAWRDQYQNAGYLLQGKILIEALDFYRQNSEKFPLSAITQLFIKKSLMQHRIKNLKNIFWLVIILCIGVIIDHNLYEARVENIFAQLRSGKSSPARYTILKLIKGCAVQKRYKWIPNYFSERLFGNCRSLMGETISSANLNNADLKSADLRSANLRDAKLRKAQLQNSLLQGADLTDANLRNANLRGATLSDSDEDKGKRLWADLSDANLNGADLSRANLHGVSLRGASLKSTILSESYLRTSLLNNADLQNANLSRAYFHNAHLNETNLLGADLSNAILLAQDLRQTIGLAQHQFEGSNSPIICNSPLPQKIKVNPDRDCDLIIDVIHSRHEINDINKVKKIVREAREKNFDK